MPTTPAVLEILKNRVAIVLGVIALAVLCAPAAALATPAPAVLSFRMMDVGSPNKSVGIVPFGDAIYKSCSEAPAPKGPHAPVCQEVGGVAYGYGIGQLEVTVSQWVAFLNTVDPAGIDRHDLYDPTESSSAWPKYGPINKSAQTRPGHHY